jgi:cysteine desulfurase
MIYLDHAATTELRAETKEAMAPFLDDEFGNPSGVHGVARRAKNAIEEARERAASLIGAHHPLDIVFTGGGTEADNLAVVGAALARGERGGVVTTAVEHEAVLQSVKFLERLGCRVSRVGVDGRGRLDVGEVGASVTSGTAVVSVMAANNETGTLFPVSEIAAAVRATVPTVLVHTDAVQAFVTEDITVAATGADMISLSAHKFGGPKGVGLLYAPRHVELEPVIHGGGQELGRRSGTHNVAAIVGMVAAMEVAVAARAATRQRIAAMRDQFESGLKREIPDIEVNGDTAHRLAQHSHMRIPGVSSETLLIRLDQAGVAAAAGSACHSGAIEVSHVLAAMGLSDEAARECVRFTFGWPSEIEDGERAAKIVASVVAELR